MSAIHKVGDAVQIKNVAWYRWHSHHGFISFGSNCFFDAMSEYCSKKAVIQSVKGSTYKLDIDDGLYDWTDEMFAKPKKKK